MSYQRVGLGLTVSDFGPTTGGAGFSIGTGSGSAPASTPSQPLAASGSAPAPLSDPLRHRAPPAEFVTFYTLAETQLQQQAAAGPLLNDPLREAIKSGAIQITKAGASTSSEVTLGTGYGLKPGATPTGATGNTLSSGSSGSGSGSGSSTSSDAFQAACAQVNGSYSANSGSPCCAMSDGRYIGVVNGAPALVSSCGAAAAAAGLGGGAGVVALGGAALLALLLFR